MQVRIEKESLNIVILLSSTLDIAYSIALKIVEASAVYIEQLESFHWIMVLSHMITIIQ